MGLVVVLSLACSRKSNEPNENKEKVAPSPAVSKEEQSAKQAAFVARLNESYKEKGSAALEEGVLVVRAKQCGDAKQAAQLLTITRKAAARVGIEEVRCDAPPTPPAPTKEELVEVFNQQFSDIGAVARIEDDGKTLVLETNECDGEANARSLLEKASELSRKAGFELLRCGSTKGTKYELAIPATGSP